MRRFFGFGFRPKIVLPDEPEIPADDGDTIVGPIVPRAVLRPNHALPILIVASMAVHATIMLPSLLGANETTAPPPPHEIPIEVVQLPPKPPEQPRVLAKKAQEKKAAEKAAPKPRPAPKPQQVAQKQPAKPNPPKPNPPKPSPSKPSPQKMSARQQPKPDKPAPDKPSPQRSSPPKPTPAPETASTSERLKDLLGGMPAVALPGASDTGTDTVSYTQLVLSKLAKAKREGSHRGMPGAASVSFTIGDAGEIARVEIVRPSGDPDLDGEAIAMVKRGAPYPPPPPGGRRDYTITLRFQPLI